MASASTARDTGSSWSVRERMQQQTQGSQEVRFSLTRESESKLQRRLTIGRDTKVHSKDTGQVAYLPLSLPLPFSLLCLPDCLLPFFPPSLPACLPSFPPPSVLLSFLRQGFEHIRIFLLLFSKYWDCRYELPHRVLVKGFMTVLEMG